MSGERETEYSGMRWLKCDLQVQTPEDPAHWLDADLRLGDPRRPKSGTEHDETDIQSKARRYLERCHALGLDVIGVTDHNFSDCSEPRDRFLTHLIQQNRTVAKQCGRQPLHIFPGFEVDIGYHVLCLFPPTVRHIACLDVVESALSSLGLPRGSRFESGKPRALRREDAYVPLRQLLKIVQHEHNGIVIAAHAFSNDGICKGSSHREDFLLDDLLCVEVSGWPLGVRETAIIQAEDGDWSRNRPVAAVMSSDAKSLQTDDDGRPQPNSLGCRFSWIKMSTPSVEGLRQAFLDPDSRIRLPSAPFEARSPTEIQRHARILSLGMKGTRFLAPQHLLLSPNLNCIIGGRGTGKSTLLEYARLCLNRDSDATGRASEQVDRIRGTLSGSSRLSLVWQSQDGVREEMELSGGHGREAAIIGRDVAEPAAVFGAMDVRIYSQGQLSELTKLDEHRQPVFLLPLLDDLAGRELDELKQREAELRRDLETLFAARRALEAKRARLSVLRQEATELERQWNARAAVQTESVRHRLGVAALNYVERLEHETNEIVEGVRGEVAGLVRRDLPLEGNATQWPQADWFARLESAWGAEKAVLVSEIEAALTRFTAAIDVHTRQHPDWSLVEAEIDDARRAFELACSDRGLGPKDVDRLKEIERSKQAKESEIERLAGEIGREESAVEAISDQLDALRKTWWEQHQLRAAEGGGPESRTDFVRLSMTYMGEKGDFERLWSKLSPDGRTRLGRSWQQIGEELHAAHIASCGGKRDALPAECASPWSRLDSWLDDGSKCPRSVRPNAAELQEYLRDTVREQWERTQLTRVRDSVDLHMFRPDGSEVGSLQEGKLSDGQRNTAVLAILLARGDGPLLIDQPEDELDAAFIYQQLVPLLREVKQRRQIILVTHNPNLPVNGDAELVVALETRDGRGVLRAQGGLDIAKVNGAVLDIMEGSRAAFQRRQEKYGF